MILNFHRGILSILLLSGACAAQTIPTQVAIASLPDAPAPQEKPHSTEHKTQQVVPKNPKNPAPRLAKYIEPHQEARPLSGGDKIKLAFVEQASAYSLGTAVLAASWEHLLDTDPHYGSDSAGFGERVGAAVLRQTSQAVFSDGVLPAILHQDPRYYRKGEGKIVDRGLYSASRVLITRSDAGERQINYSQIGGYAAASALTMTYYPAVSATWGNTASGWVLSLATAALGNEVHEFLPDALRLVRRKHKD